MPINWNAENDRKLLLNILGKVATGDIDFGSLALLFPGATAIAISQRIVKLRRELKASSGEGASGSNGSVDASQTSQPKKRAPTVPKARGGKSHTAIPNDMRGRPATNGGAKRKRGSAWTPAGAEVTDDEEVENKKVKVGVESRGGDINVSNGVDQEGERDKFDGEVDGGLVKVETEGAGGDEEFDMMGVKQEEGVAGEDAL
ncbi:hypothetical protein ACLMJK_002174 [Lecanora helva]